MIEERTLKSKMLLLEDDLVAGRVSSAFNRVSQVAGYGYQPEVGRLSRLLKNYKDNGGIPDLLFDAGLSVNYNLVAGSSLITGANGWSFGTNATNIGAVTDPLGGNTARALSLTSAGFAFVHRNINLLPNTTYTASVWCRSNTPPAFQSRIEIRENNGITFYQTQQTSFTLTTAWQRISFTFTTGATTSFSANSQFHITRPDSIYTVEVALPQIVIGNDQSYRPRTDATAVKPLNLGTLGASGDGTLVNGTVGDMLSSDVTAGLVLNFNSALNQRITTTYSTFSQMNSGVHIGFWKKSPTNANARIMTNSNFDANSRIEINEFGGFARFRIMSSSTAYYQAEGSGANAFTPNVWERWDFVWSGTLSAASLIVYRNAVALSTTNTTVGSPTAITDGGTLTVGANVNGSNPYNGVLDKTIFEIGSKSATQIANIYNSQKAQYGL
jgi:hypothetical protein